MVLFFTYRRRSVLTVRRTGLQSLTFYLLFSNIMKKRNFRLKAHKDWRSKLLSRDGGCIICGVVKGSAAHHLLPACKKYDQYEYDVDNGVMLCSTHHIWGIMSAHKNPFWFYLWMLNNRPAQLFLALKRLQDEV